MFTRIFHQVIRSTNKTVKRSLGPDWPFLLNLERSGIDDVFDHTLLWDPELAEGKDPTGTALGLKQALDTHRGDEPTDRLTPLGAYASHTPVFSDVIVRVGKKHFQESLKQGGWSITRLGHDLSKLHLHDFGGDLFNNRPPSYLVIGDPELDDRTLLLQFGKGVFVPGYEDRLLGSLEYRIGPEAPWKPLPEWLFLEVITKNNREQMVRISRTMGIYEGQTTLLLGKDIRSAPIVLPELLGNVILDLNDCDAPLIFPDTNCWHEAEPTTVTSTTQGWSCVLQPVQAQAPPFEFRFTRQVRNDVSAPLKNPGLLHMEPPPSPSPVREKTPPKPEPAPAITPPAVGGNPPLARPSPVVSASAGHGIPSMVRILNDTERNDRSIVRPMSTPYRLVLQALALPKIVGTYFQRSSMPEMKCWQILLDEFGMPIREEVLDQKLSAETTALIDDGNLQFRPKGSGEFYPVKNLPMILTAGKVDLALKKIPDGIPGFYGLLEMTAVEYFELGRMKKTMGRFAPNNDADIMCGFLSAPHTILWNKPPQGYRYSLGDMDFSRRHVDLQVMETGELQVTFSPDPAKEVMPGYKKQDVYLLNDGVRLGKLAWRDRHGGVLRLTHGESLLVGGFLFRYENDFFTEEFAGKK